MSREQTSIPGILSYRYENISSNIKIPKLPQKDLQAFLTAPFEKAGLAGPPTGISLIDFSFDSAYLATKDEQMPTAVWVWDLTSLELHTVLTHLNQVKSFKFAPHSQ